MKLKGTPIFPIASISSDKIFLPRPILTTPFTTNYHKWSPSSHTSVCVWPHNHHNKSNFISNWSSPLQNIISGSKHLQCNPHKFSLQRDIHFINLITINHIITSEVLNASEQSTCSSFTPVSSSFSSFISTSSDIILSYIYWSSSILTRHSKVSTSQTNKP